MKREQLAAAFDGDRLGIIALTLLVSWFCQDLIFRESVPFFRDLSTYFYPLRFTLFESYRSGNLPLWDSHMATGFPVLASFQSGVFYPPHFIFLAVSFFDGIRILFVFHFLVAAVGAYHLARRWGYSHGLAVVAALLFAFGGTTVSLTNLLNHFQAAVWLPWLLVFWERAVCAGSWTAFLSFGLLSTIGFLAGSPEIYALNTALVALDGLRLKRSLPAVSWSRMAVTLVTANLVVVTLSMVQLAPTAELFLESRRRRAIPVGEAMTWSLEPLSLVNLLISDKEPDPSAPSGLKLFFARGTPFFVSYYMGAAAICGVWFWLLLDSWRPKLPLAVLIGVTLVLALGSHTPLYPFLYTHLWFLGALRFPEKFFYITQLLLLYAALKGFVLFLDRDEPGSRRKGLAVAALSVACMATYVYFRFHSEIVARGVSARAGVAPGSGIQSEITAAVLAGIERQTVLIVGVLLLFWLASKNVIRRLLFGALLAAVAFVDLAWTHRGLLFPLDPGFLSNGFRILPRPDPSLNRLFYYPAPHNLHPSRFVVHGRRSFEETTALFSRYLLPNEGILHGFDYFQEIDALARWPYSEFLAFANPLDASTQTRLLRSFNVRYVVAFQPLTAGGLVLLARFPGDHAWLYEIQEPVPRAYVVGHSVAESRARRVLERLASPGFDPRAEVILNAEAPLGERRAAAASARIVSYGSRSVTVQASLDGAGILVLADSYYPGWKAYVDGKEAEIYRANLFFRAVPLGAGEHVVEFKYEPRSFRLGLIVSMTTLLVLAAISLGVWRRNRRRALDAAAHGTG